MDICRVFAVASLVVGGSRLAAAQLARDPCPLDPPFGGDRMPNVVYVACDHRTPATLSAANSKPAISELLRSTSAGGSVIATFIVDEKGRVDSSSIALTNATNIAIEAAVRKVLPRWTALPARAGGKPIRERLRHYFEFVIVPPHTPCPAPSLVPPGPPIGVTMIGCE